jgi:hypothetical protein
MTGDPWQPSLDSGRRFDAIEYLATRGTIRFSVGDRAFDVGRHGDRLPVVPFLQQLLPAVLQPLLQPVLSVVPARVLRALGQQRTAFAGEGGNDAAGSTASQEHGPRAAGGRAGRDPSAA